LLKENAIFYTPFEKFVHFWAFEAGESSTMVAEAPDHHIGDLGRMEEVRNGLNGIHLVGHREELNRNCLVELFLGFRKWCKLYY